MIVSVLWLFLVLLMAGLQCVIVVFPVHSRTVLKPNLINIVCSTDNGMESVINLLT